MDFLLLEYLAKKNGMSKIALDKAMNMDPSTYYRKKKGEAEFTVKEIKSVKEALNLTTPQVNEIFFADKLA